jgi:2-succinyl-6-hydroxy-2,4-cyclohexadiene-1-carboxylate synthase
MPLFTKAYGDPTKPLLIFFHGFLGNHLDFEPLITYLTSDFHCISLDLPGHGGSKEHFFVDYHSFQSHLTKTLHDYQKFNPLLVGYSMGGRIAQQFIKTFTCRGLVLISSRVSPLMPKEKKERIIEDEKLAENLTKDSFLHFLLKWYSGPLFNSLNSDLFAKIVNLRKEEDPKLLAQVLRILSPAQMPENSYFLSHFKKPLLFMSGRQDEKYTLEASPISNYFPGAWIFNESETSHALHLESPKNLAVHIKLFYRYHYDRVETTAQLSRHFISHPRRDCKDHDQSPSRP